jgi:hypothetical protein
MGDLVSISFTGAQEHRSTGYKYLHKIGLGSGEDGRVGVGLVEVTGKAEKYRIHGPAQL